MVCGSEFWPLRKFSGFVMSNIKLLIHHVFERWKKIETMPQSKDNFIDSFHMLLLDKSYPFLTKPMEKKFKFDPILSWTVLRWLPVVKSAYQQLVAAANIYMCIPPGLSSPVSTTAVHRRRMKLSPYKKSDFPDLHFSAADRAEVFTKVKLMIPFRTVPMGC